MTSEGDSESDALTAQAETAVHTFLIADVRGHTRFTSEEGDEAAARLAAEFARIARETVAAGGGEVIELRGDEILAVFASSRRAMRSASELQQRLAAHSRAIHRCRCGSASDSTSGKRFRWRAAIGGRR
jgi:class 3 adenylate cyclase